MPDADEDRGDRTVNVAAIIEATRDQPNAAPPLKVYRVAAGFTQAELANRAGGMARGTINNIERGNRRPHPATAILIAQALGVDRGLLFPSEDHDG